jgi:hypothetical protein
MPLETPKSNHQAPTLTPIFVNPDSAIPMPPLIESVSGFNAQKECRRRRIAHDG